ncbi:DUF3048 domain-containing protein [Patescibacteria group bacterium]|nr:DUF3048 domain-containing protein [Patescibacteria group bacterium]
MIKWYYKISFFFLFVLLLSGCQLLNPSEIVPEEENEIELEEFDVEDLILLEEEKEEVLEYQKMPVAVVIDNLFSARPLAGINQAQVVYEVPVEGDITRLLAIFNQENWPLKIGPVRSARPYLADWAEEYLGLFIHAGGSPQALSQIKEGSYDFYNLDELSGDGVYFWRDGERNSPHNLYILPASIEECLERKKWPDSVSEKFIEWERRDILEQESPSGQDLEALILKINYQDPVIWQFDQKRKSYLRYQGGDPFLDERGKIVQSPNIVIQKTTIKVIDQIGRLQIETQGQGEALIFQEGKIKKGSWAKDSNLNRTFFYGPQGEKIKFLPGSLWVEIVSPEQKIYY